VAGLVCKRILRRGTVEAPLWSAIAWRDRGAPADRAILRTFIHVRNDFPSDRLLPANRSTTMADDIPNQPYIFEGLDPVPQSKSTIAEASEAVKGAVKGIGDAIETGRKPGMPLNVLSNLAREAPLGSLLVAFLLGFIVARR
jgi:hypothetical protein